MEYTSIAQSDILIVSEHIGYCFDDLISYIDFK